MKLQPRLLTLVVISMLFWLFAIILHTQTTEAFHFAYGSFAYTFKSPSTAPDAMTLDIEQAWNWNKWYSSNDTLLTNGKQRTISVGKIYHGLTGANYSGSTNIVLTIQSKYVDSLTPSYYWFFGTWSGTITRTDAKYFVYFYQCCRISSLSESNKDKNAYHWLWVDKRRTTGISSSSFPREYVYSKTAIDYVVPAVHPLGNTMSYGFAAAKSTYSSPWVAGTSGLATAQPKAGAATAFSYTGSLTEPGRAAWTPLTVGGYAINVEIRDADPSYTASYGTQLDFIFVVVAECLTTATNCNHAPVWKNLVLAQTVWATIPYSLTVQCSDQDVGQTIEIQHTTPPQGITITTYVASTTSSQAPSGSLTISWLAEIDNVSQIVCIKVQDSLGLPNVGNSCLTLNIQRPDYILLSGTMRDFDTDTTLGFGGTSQVPFTTTSISNTLTSSRKMNWTGSTAGSTTAVTKSMFDVWWSDASSTSFTPYLYTTLLSRYYNNAQLNNKYRIYTFRNGPDGFWPLDDKIGGGTTQAVADSNGHNRFFTYEIHTTFDYLRVSAEQYNYKIAGGEMWIFMNNRLALYLNGLTSTTGVTGTINLAGSGIATGLGLTSEVDSYNYDVFITQRSNTINTLFEMEVSDSTACSAITLLNQPEYADLLESAEIFDWTSTDSNSAAFLQASVRNYGVSTLTNTINLINTADTASSGAVWYGSVTDRLKVLSGFQAEFTFKMTPSTANGPLQGLAFVLQDSAPTARGGDGSGMGYSSLVKSLALEFDAQPNTGVDNGATFHHISMHTNYELANSASETAAYWPLGSSFVGNLPNLPFTFTNDTDHRIRVEFSPGSVYSWFNVYINDNIRPIYSAQVDAQRLATTFPNGAFMGFTSSTGAPGAITVSRWRTAIVPALASATGPVNQAQASQTISGTAGLPVNLVVQLRDACRQPLYVSGESERFIGSLVHSSSNSNISLLASISDNSLGQYGFSTMPTVSGDYNYVISYQELGTSNKFVPIGGASTGYKVSVTHNDNDASQSYYLFSNIQPKMNNNLDSTLFDNVSATFGGITCVEATETTHKQVGNGKGFTTVAAYTAWRDALATTARYGCTLVGSHTGLGALFTTGGQFASAGVTYTAGKTAGAWAVYKSTGFTTSSFSNGQRVFVVGKATNDASSINVFYLYSTMTDGANKGYVLVHNSELISTTEITTFYVLARDVYGNPCTNLTTKEITYSFSPALNSSAEMIECTTPNLPFIECSFKVGSSKSNVYAMTINTGGVQVGATGSMTISAGAASYLTSLSSGLSTGGTVNTSITFTVTLYDINNNQVLSQTDGAYEIKDLYFTTTAGVRLTTAQMTISYKWNATTRMFDVSYNSQISGIFIPVILVNGTNMASSSSLNVVVSPGPVSSPSTSYSIDDNGKAIAIPTAVKAGVQVSYIIQARDALSNARTSANDNNGVFTLTSTVSDAFDGTPTVQYNGNGIYNVLVTYRKTGSIPIVLSLVKNDVTTTIRNIDNTANAAYTIVVSPGVISNKSTAVPYCGTALCDTSTTPSIVAGNTIRYQLTLLDQYSNPVSVTSATATSVITAALAGNAETDTSKSYTLRYNYQDKYTIVAPTASTNVVDATLLLNYSGSYNIVWSSLDSGELTLAKPHYLVTVVPGSSDITQIQAGLTMPGIVSSTDNTLVTFVDRDALGNKRDNITQTTFVLHLAWPDKSAGTSDYTCVSTAGDVQCTIVPPANMGFGQDGVMNITFGTSKSQDYTFSVLQNDNVYAVITSIKVGTEAAVTIDSKTRTLPSLRAGVAYQITVTAYTSQDLTTSSVDIATGLPSLNLFQSPTSTASGSFNFVTAAAQVDQATQSTIYIFNISYTTAQLNYQFMIRGANISSAHPSDGTNATNPYILAVLPGPLSITRSQYVSARLETTAGKSTSISFLPYDVYGNAISTTAQLYNTNATLTPIITVSTVASGTATCTFTTTVSPAVYDCKFTAGTAAGSKVLQLSLSSEILGNRIITYVINPDVVLLSNTTAGMSSVVPAYGSSVTTRFPTATPLTAGVPTTLYIYAYDQYGNASWILDTAGTRTLTLKGSIGNDVLYTNIEQPSGVTTTNVMTCSTFTLLRSGSNIYTGTCTMLSSSRYGYRLEVADNVTGSTSSFVGNVAVRSGVPAAVSGEPTALTPTRVTSGLFMAPTGTTATTANPNPTVLVSSTTALTIDSTFLFYIRAYDSNKIPFVYNSALASSSAFDSLNVVLTTIDSNGDSRPVSHNVDPVTYTSGSTVYTTPGLWRLTIPSTSVTTTGQYTAVLNLAIGTTSTVSIGTYTFNVGPGYPIADYTSFNSVPTLVSGILSPAIKFKLYDRINNLITGDKSSAIVLTIHNGSVDCGDVHPETVNWALPESKYDFAPQLSYTGNAGGSGTTDTGEYTLFITPPVAATFTFNVTVSPNTDQNNPGSIMSCTKNLGLSFTVTPGMARASASWYTIRSASLGEDTTVSSLSAGQRYVARIRLVDHSNTPVYTFEQVSLFAQQAVYTGSTITSQPAFASTVTNGLYWDGKPSVSPYTGNNVINVSMVQNIQALHDGIIDVTFTPRSSGDAWQIWFGLNETQADNTQVWKRITGQASTTISPQVMKVGHGSPVSIQIVTAPPKTITAGQTVSFTLKALDEFNNDVTTNALHTVTATVSRQGSTFQYPPVSLDSYLFEAATATSSTGITTVTFTPSWEGQFTIDVVMRSRSTGTYLAQSQTQNVQVNHANCAALYLATNPTATLEELPTQTCASTGVCVVNAVTDCTTKQDQTICPAGTFWSSSSCVDITTLGYVKCADGTYKTSQTLCQQNTVVCPAGTTACSSDATQCRANAADCPATPACPIGYSVCPNQSTCATSLSSCPVVPSTTCTSSQYQCPSGACVASAVDCPTPVTCPTGQVFCLTDQSCQADASKCAPVNNEQKTCVSSGNVLCPGTYTCATSYQNCPTEITCPITQVLCPDNSCKANGSSCQIETVNTTLPGSSTYDDDATPTTLACPVTQFRCADTGTCVENLILCPSAVTCPTLYPVRCPDGSCKGSSALCAKTSVGAVCNPLTQYVCPGTGICVDNIASCSISITCPQASPILCSDNSCVSDISSCPTPQQCSTALPYTCPSGVCRASVLDCPSEISCPSNKPMVCSDGTCAIALEMCSTNTIDDSAYSCPTGQIKCPTGNCAASILTCPTSVTCPIGSTKCSDGRCSTSCATATAPTCTEQGLIVCPMASAGIQCASNVSSCPSSFTCPVISPVRCIDATCAISVDACPSLPDSDPPSTKIPCPDGSWTFDTCPTPVTCPSSLPYKCPDQTCKQSPSECIQFASCSDDAPYRCTSGSCAVVPWDCTAPVDGVCTTDKPFKCPVYKGSSICVANVDTDCPIVTATNDTVDPYESTCAASFTYCRDGSCKETVGSCNALTCPVAFPYVCPDGTCAKTSAQCPVANGCPYDAPVRCPGYGSCVTRLSKCPVPSCPSGLSPCADGSCSNACQIRGANGCATNYQRCADGTCVSEFATCTSAANTDSANSCPPGAPYRCAHGLCVEKSSQCISLDNSVCTDSSKPVLCASGQCYASASLCPLIKPCPTTGNYARCDDGTCRNTDADLNVCPLVQTCPTGQIRCKQSDFGSTEILDGVCALPGQCPGKNGCPLDSSQNPLHRCESNGRCVSDVTSCDTNTRQTNGCPGSAKYKCWNGQCASDPSLCPATNNCPSTAPVRCQNGTCKASSSQCTTDNANTACDKAHVCADGTCTDNILECSTTFGCPVNTPIRCHDGSCAQYPATYRAPQYKLTLLQIATLTCPLIASCPDNYLMCETGECVLSSSDCPSVLFTCNSNQIRCPQSGRCVGTISECSLDDSGNPVATTCPTSLPVMCSDGACVTDIIHCTVDYDPRTSTLTGSASNSGKDATKPYQVMCHDGSYRDNYSQCISDSKAVYDSLAELNNTTNSCVDYCSDGRCLLEGQTQSTCDVITGCTAGQYRCTDGTCRSTCPTSDMPSVVCSDSTQVLCMDGICRTRGACPSYDGCGYFAGENYQCPNRHCAYDADGCDAAAIRDADFYSLDLLQDSTTDFGDFTGQSLATNSIINVLRYEHQQQKQSLNTIDVLEVNSGTISKIEKDIKKKGLRITPSSKSKLKAYCTSDCLSSIKVNNTAVLYNPSIESQTSFVSPLRGGMKMTLYSGMPVSLTKDNSIYIQPVAESVVYNATNKVQYSRVEEFGTTTLTYAQSVLSPMFSCIAGDAFTEPFDIPITLTSNIDRTSKPAFNDICLAVLRRYPALNYAVWECLFTEEQRLQGGIYSVKTDFTTPLNVVSSYISNCMETEATQRYAPVTTTDDDDDLDAMIIQQATTGQPAVYAFINAPVQSNQMYTRSLDTWWRDNVIWVLFVIVGAVVLLFVLIWSILRLTRYKGKSEKIRDEIVEMEKNIEQQENFGGKAGRKDDEILETANPLSVGLQQMRALEEETDLEKQEKKRQQIEQQQAESGERREVIDQLQSQNDRDLEQLEIMKKRLAKQA